MPDSNDSIVRNIGKFTGEIWRAIKAPVPTSSKETHEVRRTVETDVQETDEGKVTLRRTTIEEIEIRSQD
jgi:hypothetical protein